MKNLLIVSLILFGAAGLKAQLQPSEEFLSKETFIETRDAANAFFDGIETRRGVGYKPYKRWEYEAMFDSYPNGDLDKSRPNVLDEYNLFVANNGSGGESHNGDWTSFGSGDGYSTANITRPTGGYGGGAGRINCIAGHPTNSNILLAGAPAGGLWKSTNGGDSWFSVSDGIPQMGISEIVYDPINSNIIYLNTGDGDGRNTQGVGILKSTDGGDSWNMAGNIAGANAWYGYDMEIHPTNPNILFVTSRTGLYITYDAGDTWTQLSTTRYYDVEFKVGDPSTVFCAFGSGLRIYQSTGGPYVNLGAVIINSNGSRIELETCPSAPGRLYAFVGSTSGGYEGMYWSVDDGASWSLLNDTPNILLQDSAPSDDPAPSQAWYDLAFVVSDTNDFDLLVGGINIWGSDTGSILGWELKALWTYAPELAIPGVDYVHADIHDLVDINGVIYACCDGGIFRSYDFGDNWVDCSDGLVISQPYRIDSHASTSNKVIGGCQDIGMNMYDSDDEMEHLLGGDGMGADYVAGNSNQVYVTKQNGDLYYSSTGGNTYTNIDNPEGPFYTHFVLNPEDSGDKYFGGEFGLFRELNGGGWPSTALTSMIDTIVYVEFAPNDPNVVYACEMGNIIRSGNALSLSPTFSFVTNNLPAATAPLRGISIDPTDSDHVWVTFRGWVDGEKVYESFNGGDSWINRTENLGNFPVHCVYVDPLDPNGTYIGTEIGVFYRNTYTDGWMWFSNGLPIVPVYDINILTNVNKIRIATFGRGVWESALYQVCENALVLTNGNDPGINGFSGQQYYEAGSTLSSTRTIEGGLGVNVAYRSGDYIELLDGFEVMPNSLFEAKIGPCTGSAPPLIIDPNLETEAQ